MAFTSTCTCKNLSECKICAFSKKIIEGTDISEIFVMISNLQSTRLTPKATVECFPLVTLALSKIFRDYVEAKCKRDEITFDGEQIFRIVEAYYKFFRRCGTNKSFELIKCSVGLLITGQPNEILRKLM